MSILLSFFYTFPKPPVEVEQENNTKALKPLQISCNLTVTDFVNIDDSKGLFSIIFRWDNRTYKTREENN